MNEFNAKCASKVVDAARIFETEHSFQADRNAGIKAVDVWLSRYAGEEKK